ncbi:MAG: response regulator [Bryobacteraceae bacterium]|nr:response regulator [Bryobacteraceae bacterium]
MCDLCWQNGIDEFWGSAGTGVLAADSNSVVRYADGTARRLLGSYPPGTTLAVWCGGDFQGLREGADGWRGEREIAGRWLELEVWKRAPDAPGWMAVVADATPRKQAQRQAECAEARLRDIQNLVAEYFWETDRALRLTYVTDRAAEFFGEAPESLIGRSLLEMAAEEHRQDLRSLLENAMLTASPVCSPEFPGRTPAGETGWKQLTAAAFRDASGSVAGLRGCTREAGERVRARQASVDARRAAEAASRAQSEFISRLSHEIRTPLNAMIGMASLLLAEPLSPGQREYVQTIRRSGDSVLALLNEVLDLAKIQAGRLELENREFDLLACVEASLDVIAPQVIQKDLQAACFPHPGLPAVVTGDCARLRQVLSNLLGNAAKFTPRGSVILEIEGHPQGEDEWVLHFSVRDSGVGIPAAGMSRLFREFSQAETSTARQYGGTGLGLSISKRLVEMMGGEIHAESTEGKGSTFRFTIRVKASPAAARLADVLRLPVTSRNARVLTRFADPGFQSAIRAFLGRWGFDPATTADTGAPGILAVGDIESLRSVAGVPTILIGARRPEGSGRALPPPVRPSHLLEAIARALENPGQPCSTAPHRSDGRDRLAILIAEDNPVNQKVARLMLQKLGCEADSVTNGVEAMEALSQKQYDLIFMDIQMPEMDGLDATRQIRATLAPDRQPWIIAMTANVLESDRRASFDAGMNDFVAKPIQVEDLENALRRFSRSVGRGPAAPAAPCWALPQQLSELASSGDAPVVEDLLSLFLATAAKHLAGIQAAAGSGAPDAVRKRAHSLKGSAAQIGAVRLAELSRQIEQQATAGPVNPDSPVFREIENEFSNVTRAIQSRLGRSKKT